MRKMLEFQADQIEAVLTQHKAPGRVAGGTVTPRWVRFKVFPALGTRIATVKNLSEELAAALDAPSCRVARQGAAVMVEVPRADARQVELLPLMDELDNVPAVTAALGISDDGAPLLIRLPSPDVGHILVSGTTGSGKTALMRTMVLSLALRHPRRGGLALVLIDPKGRAFADLAGLPQLARPVVVDGATQVLAELVALMERRDARRESTPPVVVVIDELADLMMTGGKEAEYQLTRLVQRGREAGIHVVAATQKPSSAVVGSLVKANFPVRIVGKVTSAQDARVASGWPGTGAERLLGRGDFIAVAEGQTHRFQAAYIADEEVAALMVEVWEKMPRRVARDEMGARLALEAGAR
jgi:S-DNA-T family DNA segregation ATPase FtsK/SpoIIIE